MELSRRAPLVVWGLVLVTVAAAGALEGSHQRRLKRQSSPDGVYEVEISVPVQSDSVTHEDTKQVADVQKLIKDIILDGGQFDVNSQLPNVESDPGSVQIDTEYRCQEGKVLVDRSCVACAAGTYFDLESRTCRKCAIGSYQSGLGQSSCIPCPDIAGKQSTTQMRGAQTADLCKERCEAGRYFDSALQLCKPCGVGRYQGRAGQFSCYQCERGLTTRGTESTSAENCTKACESGFQLAVDNTCQPCPRGTYRASGAQQTCTACPEGTTTESGGATSAESCSLPVCQPGSFLNSTEGHRCQVCPLATYQPDQLATGCIDCPPDTTTQQTGSTSAEQCTNPCNDGGGDSKCDANALCLIDLAVNSFRCECKLGFRGDGYNCTDRCDGFCDNAGVCSKNQRTGDPECACTGSFTGDRCAEKSQFAYIASGVAGLVLLAIICVLFVWMICARANRKNKQQEAVQKAMTAPPDAASQVNFYYGAPTPYAESIAPSHHSNYAHYYDEEDEAWEMPNFYNEAFVRDNGTMGGAGTLSRPQSGVPSMYGMPPPKQEELYDRLRKHAYTGRRDDGVESQEDQPL
ncbi:sushi, von Willebrand factor type A, EGF and pentraxin domain-containing protein 1-like [Amphibalanus amphitrite]|uniref:sushi, von Willebrand factor type A, EGF and pentraxin domain-containing protein 1-like n=1 Tax=Amphibalanus amphitrite TaxID=1232801 RepID=UPI001C917004|nr:sushi, von Willebrand factor type A, EGF and pentraxin domain-containing protein 1-like [Amphibalanus amphitrite]